VYHQKCSALLKSFCLPSNSGRNKSFNTKDFSREEMSFFTVIPFVSKKALYFYVFGCLLQHLFIVHNIRLRTSSCFHSEYHMTFRIYQDAHFGVLFVRNYFTSPVLTLLEVLTDVSRLKDPFYRY